MVTPAPEAWPSHASPSLMATGPAAGKNTTVKKLDAVVQMRYPLN